MAVNHQVILAEKPRGKLALENFRFAEAEIPKPADGEVLVKARYVSLDAANRAWMQGVTYRAALGAGEVMAGGSLAEVVESRADHQTPDLSGLEVAEHVDGRGLSEVLPYGHDGVRQMG